MRSTARTIREWCNVNFDIEWCGLTLDQAKKYKLPENFERPGEYEWESFIGKLRDELLNGEIFDTLLEARVLTERWRREYNGYRPHSSLGNISPEEFAALDRTLETSLVKTPEANKNDLQNFGLT